MFAILLTICCLPQPALADSWNCETIVLNHTRSAGRQYTQLVMIDGVGNRQSCLVRVREGMRVEVQRGKRELGLSYRPLARAVQEQYQQLVDEGLLETEFRRLSGFDRVVAYRFDEGPAQALGRVRAKTGTLTGASSLAGVVSGASTFTT